MTENDVQVLRATGARFETALTDVERTRWPTSARRPRERLQGLVDELSGSLQRTRRGLRHPYRRTGGIRHRGGSGRAEQPGHRRARGPRSRPSRRRRSFRPRERRDRSNDLVRLGVWFLVTVTVMTILLGFVAWKFFGERLLVRIGRLSRRHPAGCRRATWTYRSRSRATTNSPTWPARSRSSASTRWRCSASIWSRSWRRRCRPRTTKLEDTLENLRRTQQQVVKQEKLASLGALTAGIAHEIRNPLNFVNNFAALSTELIEELKRGVGGVGER